MDELKLSLGPSFLRQTLAKIIGKVVQKKLGCGMDILIKEIHVTTSNGKISVHADLDVEMSNEDLMKLIKQIDLA